jgi:AcrR family transcriptional regulator
MYELGVTVKIKPAADTADRLLDVAERLFGERGYDGVGMRLLAEAAGVNLGAATYHFGSKQALYLAVFHRRFRPMDAERLRRLREAVARAQGRPLPVEVIVECLLRPPFESGIGNTAFQQFLARNLLLPPSFLHRALHREVGPTMAEFAAALHQALPHLPGDLLHLRSMFAMGSLAMFSTHAKTMPGMRNREVREAVLREMIGYVTAGMTSPALTNPQKRPPLPRRPGPADD